MRHLEHTPPLETVFLQAENLSKEYATTNGALQVLNQLSFSVARGESVAIMGPSGCGKSTLLQCLAGLDTPTSGRIFLEGQDIVGLSKNDLHRLRAEKTGIVFQQFHLFEHLTALENVRLPLDLRGDPNADQKALLYLDQVGLKDRARHFPAELSRGECQRVAIARVMVMNPPLWLADEPTGSLDAKTGIEIVQLILELAKKSQATLIVVTHDPAVARLMDRTLNLRAGVLVE